MAESQKTRSWFGGLKSALQKSRAQLVPRLSSIFKGFPIINEALWQGIEELLVQSDVGVKATTKIIENLRQEVGRRRVENSTELLELLREQLVGILSQKPIPAAEPGRVPGLHVYLIVGVNGTGKTTAIAKMARRAKQEGQKVLLAAADTYRAAAIEQLSIWADRVGADMVKHQRGADAAAVVYDSIQAAKARGANVILVDTAGRLHTQINLIEELKKIKRVAEKETAEAQVETLLVIDATTGQNGLSQARLFNEALKIDGVILTKLDGTAKGGIVIAIQEELGLPVKFVGVGERLEDLRDFDPPEFASALLSTEPD
jgi:fused signal recognition particle receptor